MHRCIVAPLSLWVHRFGFLFSPTATMKQFFKSKRKQSPEPLPQDTSPGIPADIAAGTIGYKAQLNTNLEGGRARFHQDPEVDLTVAPDQGSSGGSQMVFQGSTDKGQELPASEAWTSGVVIGGRKNRTSECFLFLSLRLGPIFMWIPSSDEDAGDTGGKIIESAEASRSMCRYHDGVGCSRLTSAPS